jgi:hypothetical protein
MWRMRMGFGRVWLDEVILSKIVHFFGETYLIVIEFIINLLENTFGIPGCPNLNTF